MAEYPFNVAIQTACSNYAELLQAGVVLYGCGVPRAVGRFTGQFEQQLVMN
jgi:hypothetical protein